jgi:ERCC4-type nuclease
MAYTIIKDTREKVGGWDFLPSDLCLGTEIGTLKTGDYTIKGMESIISIERKKSVSEIAMNVGKKQKPFEKEMVRLSKFKHAFILCEFSVNNILEFPKNSGIPRDKIDEVKITGKFILKCLMEYQIEYNVRVLFCDNNHNAIIVANSLFKRLYENAQKS